MAYICLLRYKLLQVFEELYSNVKRAAYMQFMLLICLCSTSGSTLGHPCFLWNKHTKSF